MEVAQVGDVRTRTEVEAEAMAATAVDDKKRKLNTENVQFSSSFTHLRKRKITNKTVKLKCSSCNLDDHVSTSCCSSNGSSSDEEIINERIIQVADLEKQDDESVEVETPTYYYSCRERREMTPSSEVEAVSDNLDSTTKQSPEADSRRRSASVKKMPSEAEMEEFFANAQKELQQNFSNKYNFDFEKEEPTKEGRYEWIKLKP